MPGLPGMVVMIMVRGRPSRHFAMALGATVGSCNVPENINSNIYMGLHQSLHSTTLLQMVGPMFLLSIHRVCTVQQMLSTYHYNGLLCLPYLYIGFSFGGLIAVAIAAKIWNLPHVSVQNLRRLKCVTFGQPQIRMMLVEQVVDRVPEFVECIHALYLENDSVPHVMASLDRPYEQQSDPVPLPDLLHDEVSNQVYILCLL